MNGLTLRISSDKKAKPIKKEIAKEDICSLLPIGFTGITNYGFDTLLSATSVEEQVKAMKQIFSFVVAESTDNEASFEIIQVLTNIFLCLKPKSSLISPLLKFFSNLPATCTVWLEECMTSQLKIKLSDPDLTPVAISDYSMILLLCLESKHFQDIPLSSCMKELLDFVLLSLEKCHKKFQNESIPVKKLELINGVHSCLQVGISVTQKFEVPNRELFISLAVEILSDSDLPYDTRATAGVLAAHLSVRFGHRHWVNILEDILSSGNFLGVLSYCSGLLNVLSSEDLQREILIHNVEKKTISHLYNLIISIEEKNASEPGIVLSSARCMVLLTRLLINLPSFITNELLETLLMYLWNHVEHHMDAVRHLAMSSLSNIKHVAENYPELQIFQLISESLQEMSIEKRSKHAAISVLITHIPVNSIITNSPGLVKSLLSAALDNPPSNYAINSLEELIRQDFKEQTDKTKWFEMWVNPLLSAKLSAPLEQLLTTVLKIHPPIIENIVNAGFDENNQNIAVILTCLKIGRKFNIIRGSDNSQKWKGLVDLKILENCMYAFNDDIRLSCFALLVESSKTTEEFTTIEISLIKTFLKYNFNNQDPAVRQKSLAFCKKFLSRLKDSQSSLLRRQLKSPRSLETFENISYVLQEYSSLIRDVKTMCLDSLFPGASPSRRSFSFGLLAIYKDLGFWTEFSENTVQTLLFCLLDSFEQNKVIAKELLTCMPPQLLKFNDEDHVNKYIEETLILSSSIRPPDSISAAYYMGVLASYDGIGCEPNLACGTVYHCISATLKALERELKVAEDSLLKAACSGPLYGHLFVIRYLLQDVYMRDIGQFPQWQSLIQKLINVAFDCNRVVADVVYNSSPEGHLPMDFTYSNLKKESDPQVTSQMVLLCSWRTVKEVSLLLGEISENSTISSNENGNGLISEDQILAIGEHMTELLSETKHRGAFEQAYIGFSKLTTRLWRCTSGSLYGLPRKWLEETLNCIVTNENLSATRRSAGIPFIVQALICSELTSGSCKSLHITMKYLLELTKGNVLEGRVHSLNILRALYRGSSLGEAVGPYVAEGIATAISGFNADNWAERNSATLLFSALISRVFGIPRGKSESLSWRNKMTGRLFFQRYPNLYSELLSHLEASSKVDLYPALYPVLLLLGRLYPSSLEGTSSNLQLLKYLPFVMKCAESSVLKTRSLAATAVASLIASSSYCEYISKFISSAKLVQKENHKHGLLLMSLKLVRSAPLDDLKTESLKEGIIIWINSLTDIINSSYTSFLSKDTSVQIIIQLASNHFELISDECILSVECVLFQSIFSSCKEDYQHYGCEIYYSNCSLLLIILFFKTNRLEELIRLLLKLINLPNYYLSGVALEILSFILVNESNTFKSEMYEDLKLNFNDVVILKLLAEKIRNSEEFKVTLLKQFSLKTIHHEDCVKLLEVLKFFPIVFVKPQCITIQNLQSICQASTPTIACHAIDCLNSLISYQDKNINSNCVSNNKEDTEAICSIIHEFSFAEADYDCRKSAAELLSTNFLILTTQPSVISRLGIWTSALRFILDENEEIREIVCSRLTNTLVPLRSVEKLLEKLASEGDQQFTLVLLLRLAFGENHDVFTEDSDEACVFDKGAANTYFEEIVLNQLACKFLADIVLIDSTLVNQPLDQTYLQWLSIGTNITGSSLIDFVKNSHSSLKSYGDLFKCLPCAPDKNNCLLQMHKLRNILKILN